MQLDLPGIEPGIGGVAVELCRLPAAAPVDGCAEAGVAEQRAQRALVEHLADHVRVGEIVDDLHRLDQIVAPRYPDQPGPVVLGLGHEPESHLGDDAEIALREEAGRVRAEAVAVFLPGVGVRHCAHASAHDFAIGEHRLDAADRVGVLAEERHRVAHAAIERIAEQAAPGDIGTVDPDLKALFPDIAVEVEVADTGLHEREVALVIDAQDPVHALQIDDDAAAQVGGGAAVGVVLTGRYRVQRRPEAVGDADDFLHLLDGCGRDGRRGQRTPRMTEVAIELEVLVGREDPLLANGRGELANGVREGFGADIGR